jgi:hypothetical protein
VSTERADSLHLSETRHASLAPTQTGSSSGKVAGPASTNIDLGGGVYKYTNDCCLKQNSKIFVLLNLMIADYINMSFIGGGVLHPRQWPWERIGQASPGNFFLQMFVIYDLYHTRKTYKCEYTCKIHSPFFWKGRDTQKYATGCYVFHTPRIIQACIYENAYTIVDL